MWIPLAKVGAVIVFLLGLLAKEVVKEAPIKSNLLAKEVVRGVILNNLHVQAIVLTVLMLVLRVTVGKIVMVA